MSLVNVVSVESFPSESLLKEIMKYDIIDITTPFYSMWSLKKLETAKITKVRLITRLPSQYNCAPVFLDNDPKPLEHAMACFGSSLLVYAMPDVHAKVYITNENSWLGSANFTRNGFSGKGELLLKVSPTNNEIRMVFTSFLVNSRKVSIKDMQFLVRCVNDGLTEINKINNRQIIAEEPIAGSMDYTDFQNWLGTQSNVSYITDRISNKNRMSGHVYSGFYGLSAFLLKNKKTAKTLLTGGPVADRVLDQVKTFVKNYGKYYGGPRGGTWNSKLSERLGGTQYGGGAGDAVVKHLLLIVPKYLRHKRLI